mgnify:CR=1 FL=1
MVAGTRLLATGAAPSRTLCHEVVGAATFVTLEGLTIATNRIAAAAKPFATRVPSASLALPGEERGGIRLGPHEGVRASALTPPMLTLAPALVEVPLEHAPELANRATCEPSPLAFRPAVLQVDGDTGLIWG